MHEYFLQGRAEADKDDIGTAVTDACGGGSFITVAACIACDSEGGEAAAQANGGIACAPLLTAVEVECALLLRAFLCHCHAECNACAAVGADALGAQCEKCADAVGDEHGGVFECLGELWMHFGVFEHEGVWCADIAAFLQGEACECFDIAVGEAVGMAAEADRAIRKGIVIHKMLLSRSFDGVNLTFSFSCGILKSMILFAKTVFRK